MIIASQIPSPRHDQSIPATVPKDLAAPITNSVRMTTVEILPPEFGGLVTRHPGLFYFPIMEWRCLSHMHDDKHPGKSKQEKKECENDAHEGPAFMARFADYKASPQKKNDGKS